jgi:hypothetical protein
MHETVTVEPTYHGFEGAGHGGYTAGLAAQLAGAPVEVTIRRRIPVGEPMEVRRVDGGRIELRGAEGAVLQATPAEPRVEVPAPVALAEAQAAAEGFLGFVWTPSSSCLTCGTERPGGEGLRVFTGPVDGRPGLVAAPWIPHPSFAGPDGILPEEFVWAALDCPGAWALRSDRSEPYRRTVTVQMTARVLRPVRAAEPHVVMAWPVPGRRRLLDAACAVIGPGGEVAAVATTVWLPAERPGVGMATFASTPTA